MSRHSSCCGDEKVGRSARRLAIFAVLLGLAACNPVETWRDLTGASQNDPDPETTPNTRNLAAGEAASYPNLATVPPPPTRAMTAAEREKLTQSLVADRANARYTDEQLRAGFSAAPAAPPPPPGAAASGPAGPQPAAAAVAAPPSAPAAAALPGATPGAAVPVASAPPASEAPAVESAGMAAEKPPERAAPRVRNGGGKRLAEAGRGPRRPGEPPEPAPMESSLEVPQARATPQPEQIQPAPPPPRLPPPKVASTAAALPGGLAAGGVLGRTAPPEDAAPARIQPSPAPPELPAVPPARSATAAAVKPGAKAAAPVGTPVAEIKFGESTSLTDGDRRTLQTVVPLYRQNPGKVRVIGYAGGASGAIEQLNSYRAALDRAQTVAAALTQAGIPSDKIQVEAAPAGASAGESRAEILLEN